MVDIQQVAKRWLRRAIHAAEKDKLDFYSISPVLSARLDELLHGRKRMYTVHKDIIVTSRFEEVDVSIGPIGGPAERIFVCFRPYVPKCPTLMLARPKRVT